MFPLFRRGGYRHGYDPSSLMRRDMARYYPSLRQEFEPGAGITGEYPMDVWEDDDAVHVEAEMPGFRREDINVSLQEDRLTIQAERDCEDRGPRQHVRERICNRVEHSFYLPSPVNDKGAEARLRDGVLELTLPKAKETKSRRVKVM
ncbi:MAG: Hsp20 family protein [Candidatus Eisenbacteria bacterium]|nr:Hsp20 family protein [Candidatus Eisenbacteria bacterium]